MPLNDKDQALLRLFTASASHQWDRLPELGEACYSAGCTLEEVRGCLRHLIVVAGYTTCLAATTRLHTAELLKEDTPGKVSGVPGNAFELVYTNLAPVVQHKLHEVDPVLAAYIRTHAYGDVYSDPGLSLRQKQLLMCGYLGANLPEQLFGQLMAALRFGNDREACLQAIDLGFEDNPAADDATYQAAISTFEMACKKFKKDFPGGPPPEPQLSVDPKSVCIPEAPPAPPTEKVENGKAAKEPGWGLSIFTPTYCLDVDAGLGGLGGLPTP